MSDYWARQRAEASRVVQLLRELGAQQGSTAHEAIVVDTWLGQAEEHLQMLDQQEPGTREYALYRDLAESYAALAHIGARALTVQVDVPPADC